MRIHYSECPACKSAEIAKALVAKDDTVSKENFEIWKCAVCGLLFTQDIPNQASIGQYYKASSYVSHSDTKDGLINKLYHRVRKITLKQKVEMVKKYTGKSSGVVLDIGSGTGAFLNELSKAGWESFGLEPDADARMVAEKLYGIKARPSHEIYELPAKSFDAITLWHVLEHVHDLHGYIHKFSDILKDTGVLFIAVPNHTSGDARKYGDHWAAWDVPRHLYHFSPASIERLMKQHHFRLDKTLPMWFDSFYVSMLSEKIAKGSINYVSAFTNGLASNMNAAKDTGLCSSIIYIFKRAD